MNLQILTRNAPELTQSVLPCKHCQNPIDSFRTNTEFCCTGCEAVFGILNANGLSDYYRLRDGTSSKPVQAHLKDFSFLDDPNFSEDFQSPSADRPDRKKVRFYLEGIHCAACIWLIESMPKLFGTQSNEYSIELDLGRGIATVTALKTAALEPVARAFDTLGYTPHVLKLRDQAETFRRSEYLQMLTRMGVAGACAGNIMLLAIALYAGAFGNVATFFEWGSFFIAIPALTYSAWPFYQNAIRSIKSKTLSIDLPIASALILGSTFSAIQLWRGMGENYFDSLTLFIFLLLASRLLVLRIQESVLSTPHLIKLYQPAHATLAESRTKIPTHQLKKGDLIWVNAGELIPIDGIIQSGQSYLNTSVMNGEPTPIFAKTGDFVHAGTQNQSSGLVIRVESVGTETRLGQILSAVEENNQNRTPIVISADRKAKRFLIFVFLTAALSFSYFLFAIGFSEAFSRTLALIIVTCPCALALATPLAVAMNLSRASEEGILIKNGETLEQITQVTDVFFDKTGTLTTGEFEVTNPEFDKSLNDEDRAAVLALESQSRHPVAKTLVNFIQFRHTLPVVLIDEYKEILGRGIQGKHNGNTWEIISANLPKNPDDFVSSRSPELHLDVIRNGKLLTTIRLGDSIRPESAGVIRKLQSRGLNSHLLSGDSTQAALDVARAVGISDSSTHSRQTPQDKENRIQSDGGRVTSDAGRVTSDEGRVTSDEGRVTMMIGDGMNDSLALSKSDVGVSIRGGVPISLQVSGVYLKNGIQDLPKLFNRSHQAIRTIHRNLRISFFYNLFGATAAIFGFVNPLFAAVLMPLSSISVLLSTKWGSR